jgi:hypothetical protein
MPRLLLLQEPLLTQNVAAASVAALPCNSQDKQAAALQTAAVAGSSSRRLLQAAAAGDEGRTTDSGSFQNLTILASGGLECESDRIRIEESPQAAESLNASSVRISY